MAKKTGATVKDVFWTLGQYDAVAIVEAPDDASATALGLSVAKLGNIRTQTLRAFSAADMKNISRQGIVVRESNHRALVLMAQAGMRTCVQIGRR